MLEGEVECDEVYLVAGHKGYPEAVASKGRQGRRRRLKGKRGRGTLAEEKPPILGMVQRGGQVVIQMLENVQQVTLKPLIEQTIQPGTLIYTDEYNIYARLTISIKRSITLKASMLGMKMAMAFRKFMSTRWRVSGLYSVAGYGLIAAFLRKNYPFT